jgi:hypothetical protein
MVFGGMTNKRFTRLPKCIEASAAFFDSSKSTELAIRRGWRGRGDRAGWLGSCWQMAMA